MDSCKYCGYKLNWKDITANFRNYFSVTNSKIICPNCSKENYVTENRRILVIFLFMLSVAFSGYIAEHKLFRVFILVLWALAYHYFIVPFLLKYKTKE